jgi:hypothetical protein
LGKAFATWLSVCLKIERSKVQTPVIAWEFFRITITAKGYHS